MILCANRFKTTDCIIFNITGLGCGDLSCLMVIGSMTFVLRCSLIRTLQQDVRGRILCNRHCNRDFLGCSVRCCFLLCLCLFRLLSSQLGRSSLLSCCLLFQSLLVFQSFLGCSLGSQLLHQNFLLGCLRSSPLCRHLLGNLRSRSSRLSLNGKLLLCGFLRRSFSGGLSSSCRFGLGRASRRLGGSFLHSFRSAGICLLHCCLHPSTEILQWRTQACHCQLFHSIPVDLITQSQASINRHLLKLPLQCQTRVLTHIPQAGTHSVRINAGA
mmetsp:Transcript_48043/g.89257  ORF Transcript_48043/g.89257 Transcript_48043/m.89257 type:complete len:271 (-) Transcript_48043:702-1514(-)